MDILLSSLAMLAQWQVLLALIIGSIGGTAAYILFQMLAWLVITQRAFTGRRINRFTDLDLAVQLSIFMDFLVFAIPTALLCFAYWIFTRPDPQAETNPQSQRITRWSFLAGYGSLIGLKLYALVLFVTSLSLPESVWFAFGTITPSAVLMFVGYPALMLYLRSLARRLPSRKLMRHTTIVMWGLLASVAAIGLLVLATIFIQELKLDRLAVLLIASPMVLGVVVFTVWWVVLLFVYQGRISKSIQSARRLRRASTLDTGKAQVAFEAVHSEDRED